MSGARVGLISAGLGATALLLVLGGLVVESWRLAVGGVVVLQLLTIAAVAGAARRRPAAGVDPSVAKALVRLEESVAGVSMRVAVEAQALQRLIGGDRDDTFDD